MKEKEKLDIVFKIPCGFLEYFSSEAMKNQNQNGNWNETLALVTGYWDQNALVAQDLIFPKQRGTLTDVEDLGELLDF